MATLPNASSPPEALQPSRKLEEVVPFDSSIKSISAIAFLFALATLVWSVHRAIDPNDDFYRHLHDIDPHRHRRLKLSCENLATNDTSTEDVANVTITTFEAIGATSMVSAAVGILCLLGYELFRRDPIVGKYVYDRKRLMQPGRTPPPLMLSRSLWTGNDDDDGDGEVGCCFRSKMWWCRVRPAIFEFVFLNLGKKYVRYSRAADEARKEREKNGYTGCCRTGCYHKNCFNKHGRRFIDSSCDGEGYFIDEDGYTFYPGYNRGYSHVHSRREDASERSIAEESKWKRNIMDLFPEDDPRIFFAERHQDAARGLRSSSILDSTVVGMAAAESNASTVQNIITASTESAATVVESPGSPGVHADSGMATSLTENESAENAGVNSTGSDMSMSLAQNRSVQSIGTAEIRAQSLRSPGFHADSEMRVPLLPESATGPDDANTLGTAEETKDGYDEEGRAVEESGDPEPLRYPNRLKHFFMPPGFHSWKAVLDYVTYFFFIQAIIQFFRRIPTPSLHRRHHLAIAKPGKDLTEGEEEFLRCAGLDTYLLVRMARFGFDVTFYPFLASCVTVFPIYFSCLNEGQAGGYLLWTIMTIPDDDWKLGLILVFTILLFAYIMRRLWYEWEVFIGLRLSFLENGDPSFYKSPTYLRTYRNTVIVESVPTTHRSDRNLKDVFESLFPGQIEHAEMLINTSSLEDLLARRLALIKKYDALMARYLYQHWRYRKWQQEGKLVGPCSTTVSEPSEPTVWIGGVCPGSVKRENAFTHYSKKIKEMDDLANEEYDNIVKTRLKWRDASILESSEGEGEEADFWGHEATRHLYSLFVPRKIRHSLFGDEENFFLGLGTVQFRSIAAKQSAVQCSLSGQPSWMITSDAPDPRDMYWSNIGIDRNLVENRKIIVQFVLLLGIGGWGYIVPQITQMTEMAISGLPVDNKNTLVGLIKSYLPGLMVSLILLWIPYIIFFVARNFIHFKSLRQCDEFVLIWNTGYRLANIFFTIFGISLFEAIECFKYPEVFVRSLSFEVIKQSAFHMNLVIIAAGQETMLQLLQWRSLIKQAVLRPLINVNARSRRFLDWLNEAPVLEESFIFGFYAPVLSHGLMIAIIFAFICPVSLGVCTIFFWTATKVHTHNALFVYRQESEGGGKIFYYWNRIVFITLYSSIIICFGVLSLKKYVTGGLIFLIVMTLITYCVDRSVTTTFIENSLHLPMTIAQIHDKEEVSMFASSKIKPDGGENFMYRHPIFNQDNWNKRPTWK